MQSFIVLGLGRFGRSVAKTLYDMGHEVLAIDENEALIQDVSEYTTYAVVGDITDENILKSVGAKNFDVAVVSTGKNFESSLIATQMLKEMGIKYILAKAQNELHAKALGKLGADRVVFPEQDMGIRVAHNLVSTNIIDYIELSPDYTIIEINLPGQWEGKTLKELNVRDKYGISIMAIKKGSKINVSPNAEYKFNINDILVIIGSKEEIDRFQSK